MEGPPTLAAHMPLRPGLEGLPVELLGKILSEVEDLPALLSAIVASHALHAAFNAAKPSILSSVLVSHVGVDVTPDALVATEAAALVAADDATEQPSVEAFCAEHLQVRKPAPAMVSPDKAVAIAKLSAAVRTLTDRFVQVVAETGPIKPPPTKRERVRMERALYRFETFRNLFGNGAADTSAAGADTLDPGMELFFSFFKPWELE